MRRSSSKRTDASASLAGSAIFELPGGVKVARRPVKPRGVGANPTLAANSNARVAQSPERDASNIGDEGSLKAFSAVFYHLALEIGCQSWTRTNTERLNRPPCYFDTIWH